MGIKDIKRSLEKKLKEYEENNFDEVPPWTGYEKQEKQQDDDYTTVHFDTYTKLMIELPEKTKSDIELYVEEQILYIDIVGLDIIKYRMESSDKVRDISANFSQGVLQVKIPD